MNIVDIEKLCKMLDDDTGMLRKSWKDLPHFFIGSGQNLKSARFDVNDVLFALKANGGHYECVAGPENGEVAVQVSLPGQTPRKERVCNQTRNGRSRGKPQKKR